MIDIILRWLGLRPAPVSWGEIVRTSLHTNPDDIWSRDEQLAAFRREMSRH